MRKVPVIQGLWIGKRLSTMERLCVASFLRHGHDFHLYTYDVVENVPPEAKIMDAARIVPPEKIFRYKKHPSYAGFSNLFRYKLLYEKGGYWVDMDNICLRPFPDEPEYVFSSQRSGDPARPVQVNVGVLKAPAGSEIMRYCHEKTAAKDPRFLQWGETGPKLMAKAVEAFGMEALVSPPQRHNAIDHWSWYRSIDGSLSLSDLSEADSVHLWNEMWRRNAVDKEAQFPKESLFEEAKRLYLGTEFDESRPVFDPLRPRLLSDDIDLIRDTAIAVEKLNPETAFRLMSVAHRARPQGEMIRRKLEEYRNRLGQ